MKHRFWLFVLPILAIMAIGMNQSVVAQAPMDTATSTYRVMRGTTLWDLSSKINGDPRRWTEIFDANVAAGILDSTKLRYDRNKTPIVILTVGSTIRLNRQAAAKAPTTVAEVRSTIPEVQRVVTEPSTSSGWLRDAWSSWLPYLLVFGLILIAALVIRDRMKNPGTSGPPMFAGGLTDEAAPDYFRAMASRNSSEYIHPEAIHIVNVRRGRGYGPMRVRYSGRTKDELKMLTGEVVYRATVEYPDHRQEDLFCLQICGNDLKYAGTRYHVDRLFRFEEDNASIYTPPQETVARAGNTEIRIADDELTISDAGQTITFGANDWALRKGPDGGVILSSGGRSDVEFRGGRVYGAEIPNSKVESAPAPTASENMLG